MLFDECISYQELQLLTAAVNEINQLHTYQNRHLQIGEIIDTVMPFAVGGIGVFQTATNTTHLTLPLSFCSNDDVWTELSGELISNWLVDRQFQFLDKSSELGQPSGINAKPQQEAGNIIFDAMLNKDRHAGCFYIFTGVNETMLSRYQVLMKLLLTCVYDTLIRLSDKHIDRTKVVGLTDREQQIIVSIRNGLNNKTIARQLNISVNTVKSHIYKIFQKLQAKNRVEALLKAERAGYLDEQRPV